MAYEMRSGMVNSILRRSSQTPAPEGPVETAPHDEGWGEVVMETASEVGVLSSENDTPSVAQVDTDADAQRDIPTVEHECMRVPAQDDGAEAREDGEYREVDRGHDVSLPAVQTTVLLDAEGYSWLRQERLRRKVSRDGLPGSATAIVGEALAAVSDRAAGGVPLEELGTPCDGPARRVTVAIPCDAWTHLFELAEERRLAGALSSRLSMSALVRGGLALLRSR